MIYSDWYSKIKLTVKNRARQYALSDEVFDNFLDIVYNEVMTEVNVAHQLRRVFPIDDAENLYNISCEPYIIYPDKYRNSQLLELVDITCESGISVQHYFRQVDKYVYKGNHIPGPSQYYDYGNNPFCCIEDNTPFIFVYKCIPKMDSLEHNLYTEILEAVINGVHYYNIDSLQSQVDTAVANYAYMRWFKSKEALLNRLPQTFKFEGGMSLWENTCGDQCAYTREDGCTPDCADPCSTFYANGENFIVFNNEQYHVSCSVHGECGQGESLPNYGYQCPEGDCTCYTFNVYNSLTKGFDPLSPLNSDHLIVGDTYDGCNEYGYHCDTSNCTCYSFNVLDPDTGGFASFIPDYHDGFSVGDTHGECGTGTILPTFGPDCNTPDCSCYTYRVYNPTTNSMDILNPSGTDDTYCTNGLEYDGFHAQIGTSGTYEWFVADGYTLYTSNRI